MSTHHRILLPSVWEHRAATELVGFIRDIPDEPAIARRLHGRAALNITSGDWAVSLDPTAEQLRAMAAVLSTLAADLDEATAPTPVPTPSSRHEPPRAVWPDGLTHLHGLHEVLS